MAAEAGNMAARFSMAAAPPWRALSNVISLSHGLPLKTASGRLNQGVPRMPAHQPAIITYTQRFQEALGLLCTKTPPLELCAAWLESGDEGLQSWVLEHMKSEWATGIGTIDAARFMAEQVEEGRDELVSHGVERVLRHLQREPIAMSRRRGRWVVDSCPAGLRQEDINQAVHDGLALPVGGAPGKAELHLSNEFVMA
jgi:hypothetical protein